MADEKKTPADIARSRTAQRKSKKSKRILTGIISILAVVLIAGVSLFAGHQWGKAEEQNANKDTAPEFVQKDMDIKQVDRSVTGKSVEQDQKDALDAAKNLLNASVTGEGTDAEKRMEAIASGDTSSVTAGMRKGVSLSSAYENTDTIATNAYNVLVGLSSKGFDNEKVSAANDAWRQVYVHPDLGIAFVPLSVFGQDGHRLPYTMQMVYEDGQWKLLPQSLIEAINIAGTQAEASSAASASPEPSATK